MLYERSDASRLPLPPMSETASNSPGTPSRPRAEEPSLSSTSPSNPAAPKRRVQTSGEPGGGLRVEVASRAHLESWAGPLPPPLSVRAFGEIDPSFPERIVRMAELEGEHRRHLDLEWQRCLIGDVRRQRDERQRGQTFALTITLAAFMLAGLMAWLGKEVFASVLVGVTLLGIVGVFITGQVTSRSSADLDDDEKVLTESHPKAQQP